MRLLFDENLSHKLPRLLADLFPESEHVRNVGLKRGADGAIWDYAVEHGFAIVSKDADFHQRSLLYGPPPKVIGIFSGNCPTTEIVELIREHQSSIERFLAHSEAAFLPLVP